MPPPAVEVSEGDLHLAVMQLLEEEATALNAAQIKKALIGRGVSESVVDKGWKRAQAKFRARADVIVDGKSYRWTGSPLPVAKPKAPARQQKASAISATEALDLLDAGGLREDKRRSLVAIVREALGAGGQPVVRADPHAAAKQRQSAIDAARALAELAIEVEELTANEAEPKVLVHRVRSRVLRNALEPIERAGEETMFDRTRHRPIGRSIDDGASVLVVRPGYVWKGLGEDLLIEKAVVEA